MLSLDIFPANSPSPRILCVGAHSDDIEIGCGGSMLHLLRARPDATVLWVVFSAGSPRDEEARVSASQFLEGARDAEVHIEGFRGSFFPDQWSEIKAFFEAELKSFDPDLIFTHYRKDRHQDHRVLSDLTWNTFRDHFVLEYEIPKYDGDLGQPNFYFPVAEDLADRKVNTLMTAFKSQHGRHWFTEDLFRGLMRVRGMETASRYAEAFYIRKGVARVS